MVYEGGKGLTLAASSIGVQVVAAFSFGWSDVRSLYFVAASLLRTYKRFLEIGWVWVKFAWFVFNFRKASVAGPDRWRLKNFDFLNWITHCFIVINRSSSGELEYWWRLFKQWNEPHIMQKLYLYMRNSLSRSGISQGLWTCTPPRNGSTYESFMLE